MRPHLGLAARRLASTLVTHKSFGGLGVGPASGVGECVKATCNTSSIHFTGRISSFSLMLSAISARSLTFSSGINTVVMPPRCAANNFSFKPPIGSTSPRRVISPVIATSERTGILVSAEIKAVHMPAPALGPSFGVAAFGHVNMHIRLRIEIRLETQ